MKKTFSFLAVFCLAAVANATILRVSNVEGSSAPYSSIGEALSAAAEGDTIMVDGSSISYGSLKRNDDMEVAKKVVIIGPGYWLTENGITDIGAASAIIEDIDICAEGASIYGMDIEGQLTIAASKVVVNRCYNLWGIYIEKMLEDIIIHQNVLCGGIKGELYNNSNGIFPPIVTTNNVQITNNIFTNYPSGSGRGGAISGFEQSVIANNTWTESLYGNCCLSQIYDSTVRDNIMYKNVNDSRCDGTTFSNNVEINYNEVDLGTIETDLDVKNNEYLMPYSSSAGAFTGDTPYVISGVPAGPVIQDLIVPASVEKGSKLQVTIKVGIQQ